MKELQVTYNGLGGSFWLGTLAEDRQDLLFQYSPQALERQLELSPVRLPLRVDAYPDERTDFVKLLGVPGLIYDSLPDSWGFGLMRRRMKALGADPQLATTLDRLAYLGSNTMGALTYSPSIADVHHLGALTASELAQEVRAVLTDDAHEVLAELARAGGPPGGARPKSNVFFNPSTGQMSTQEGHVKDAQAWLVKFPGDNDPPDSCALEELYAKVARECQLGMATTRFFRLPGGLTVFGTQRFDRRGADRVHVHSLAGLLHSNFQEPSLSYEDFFRATRRLTRDQRQLVKAVKRCVFNVLMNNRDDHAKNLAFMMEADGSWHLAPPYDLTFSSQGEHWMDIAGEARSPTRQDVLRSAQAAGLSRGIAEQVIDEVLERASPSVLLELADGLPLMEGTLQRVHLTIHENFSRLS